MVTATRYTRYQVRRSQNPAGSYIPSLGFIIGVLGQEHIWQEEGAYSQAFFY
jgi:hypothetical protein